MPTFQYKTSGYLPSCPPKSGVVSAAGKRPLRRLLRIAHSTRALPAALALFVFCLETALASAPPAGAASAVPAGSVVQVVAGLAVVLALVGAAAWLLKRFSGLRGTGSGLIRIVGGAAVGQRERIVLVEIGGTWLLVGVAPGQVRALHTMPKNEFIAAPGVSAPADQGFASWLRRMTDKRNHD